jgi:hypothetical protein
MANEAVEKAMPVLWQLVIGRLIDLGILEVPVKDMAKYLGCANSDTFIQKMAELGYKVNDIDNFVIASEDDGREDTSYWG